MNIDAYYSLDTYCAKIIPRIFMSAYIIIVRINNTIRMYLLYTAI